MGKLPLPVYIKSRLIRFTSNFIKQTKMIIQSKLQRKGDHLYIKTKTSNTSWFEVSTNHADESSSELNVRVT
jgi:hypothetical protein